MKRRKDTKFDLRRNDPIVGNAQEVKIVDVYDLKEPFVRFVQCIYLCAKLSVDQQSTQLVSWQ